MALFVRRRWPWAVAAVGVVAAVVLAAVLLTGNEPERPTATGDPDIVETAEPVPEPTLPAVALEALLTAPDAELRTYRDHQVTAAGVRVLSVVAPDAVWVGESPADRVLVALVGLAEPFRFQAGARLSFVGTVRPIDRDFGSALGLRGADLDDLARQGTYVEITEYTAG